MGFSISGISKITYRIFYVSRVDLPNIFKKAIANNPHLNQTIHLINKTTPIFPTNKQYIDSNSHVLLLLSQSSDNVKTLASVPTTRRHHLASSQMLRNLPKR
jgi:hypothetical protein